MPDKPYKTLENAPMTIGEPVEAYRIALDKIIDLLHNWLLHPRKIWQN